MAEVKRLDAYAELVHAARLTHPSSVSERLQVVADYVRDLEATLDRVIELLAEPMPCHECGDSLDVDALRAAVGGVR